MAEKKDETVVLIAPNGQTVSVDESKADERLVTGYRRPEKTATRSGKSSSK